MRLLVALPWIVLVSTPFASATLPPMAQDFLESFCIDCHDKASHKAGLDLESLPFTPEQKHNAQRWEALFDRVHSGQMPPKKSDQPDPEARKRLLQLLGSRLSGASLERAQSQGRVPIRRLTRAEYEHTLHDLLHIRTPVRHLFPEDASTAGFDKVAEGLSLSATHFAKYQEAAELALREAVPSATYAPLKISDDAATIFKRRAEEFKAWRCYVKDDAFVLPSNLFYPYTAVLLPQAPRSGRYRIRVTARALHSEGRPLPLVLSIHNGLSFKPDAPEVSSWHDIPADAPRTITSECVLAAKEQFHVYGWTLPQRDTVRDRQKRDNLAPEDWTGPSLAISRIECEGPLTETGAVESWPPSSYRVLFDTLPLRKLSELPPSGSADSPAPGEPLDPSGKKASAKTDPLVPYSANPEADAERLLRRFVPVAFRGPVAESTLAPYLEAVRSALAAGTPFHEAMIAVYKSVLCSPHLLFLKESPGALDGFAIASRLSYFLWNSPPDEALLLAAASGALGTPGERHRQVERLLQDPKSRRFEQAFLSQWLDLQRIDATAPDAKLYPEFDRSLQESALAETQLFFRELLEGNRSVLECVQSDWTFLNERLARHYGLPPVDGFELRKTSLPAGGPRGGLLTQASILKVTADGAKTSPILRGKWVCERILGVVPPPPPEDVPKIEPDIRGATTIRQQLARHRDSPACASCHALIDPPGFALENFDVIGGWREYYRASQPTGATLEVTLPSRKAQVHRGPSVEPGYWMADGRPFADVQAYKQLLLSDSDALARAFASKLLTFATGAPVQFADREEIESIVAGLREERFGVRSLIHRIIETRAFLHK